MKKNSLEKKEIENLLPHREPMLLIDKLINIIHLKSATATDENLMPRIIHAVKAHATLGEISDTLRSVFGEY